MKKQNMKRILSLSMLITAVMLFLLLIQPLSMLAVALDEDSHTHEGVTFAEWTSTNSLPTEVGNYYLTGDVTISSTWNVPEGTTNLCLNGHGIKKSGGSVISVGSSTILNIYDCGTTTHYFDVDSDNCAININETASDGRKSFTGGFITGGSVTNDGGITVSGGTLNLYGGTICGNKATGSGSDGVKAGAVYLKNSAHFTMTGGEISYNYSAKQGGAICTDKSAVTVDISGGEIKGNKAERWGAAIWAGRGDGSSLSIRGNAKIIDNISQSGEASVNVAGVRNYIISDDPTIEGKSGISKTKDCHLNLDGGSSLDQKIELSDALTNDTGEPKITISAIGSNLSAGNTIVFTKSWSTYMGNADPSKYFKLDTSVEGVKVVRKNGEAAVAPSGDKYITFNANGGTGTMDSQLVSGSIANLNTNAFQFDGYIFAGWNTKADGSGTAYEGGVNITLTEDIMLYAQWEALHTHDGITFAKWTSTDSLPTTAGNYYLTADVTISSTWEVPTGTTNLCLCGHGIKKTGTGGVIKVGEGRTLKLYDCDTTTEHRYSVSNPAANGAGVATVNDALTSNYQTFTGGYITGGYLTGGYQYGAGINLEGNGATLYMYGGTIIGNRLTAGSTGGGGVCVQDWDKSGGFYMYGGSIIGNTSNYGGGVYVRTGRMELIGGTISKNVANGNIGGGVLVFGGGSTLVVQGGAISNNTAVHGGAVEASGDGTVIISGGNFTNNLATSQGGALTNQRTDGNTSPASFNISGAPVFSGNTAGGSANDFYLCNTAVLNLTAAMTNTTKIGITKASSTGVFTSGWSTYMTDGEGKVADPTDYFVSNNGYEIVLIGNEVNVHQHNYGSLIEQVDSTCEADGLKAHYYCAGCGQYLDENQAKVSYDELVIEAGHSFVHRNRVEPTCTEYGKREHFYCTECGLYFNTNKQQVAEWSLSIGSLGHDYDFDNAVFTWTPDDSAYYKFGQCSLYKF